MIRYIKIKNFRSFTEFDFNLMSKNNNPLKLAIIYGENGSGKSNIINVLNFLYDSFQTMNYKKIFMSILNEHPDIEDKKNIYSLLSSTDITDMIRSNKTVGSDENMIIEFGFVLNSKIGSYLLEFNSEQIIHEKLEYTLIKNKGVYFDISANEVKISDTIFSGFKKDIIEMISKYWGKHSVIALLNNAQEEFSSNYFKSNVSTLLISLLKYFNSICIYFSDTENRHGVISSNTLSPDMYVSGELPITDTYKLDIIQNRLNKFFTSMYRDIKMVFYDKKYNKSTVKYELYFSRYISGKERIIHYSDESCGTQSLIYLLPYCLAATQGQVVAIDEIDNGIHDILLLNMLIALYKNITGQVLITTHNTLLLNEYSFKDSFFFIEVDNNGLRKIHNPSDFGYRIQPDSNVVLNYLQDRFKGLPWNNMNINFNEILTDTGSVTLPGSIKTGNT